MIREFQGNKRWLSNFAPVRIKLGEFIFPSIEHAYMSAKSYGNNWKKFCAKENNTAGQVKRASRNIELVKDWDSKKIAVMTECVKQKFSQEPYKTKLLSTGKQHIQEGNNWGDKFWGVCLKTNRGENHLGKLIMEMRDSLNETEKDFSCNVVHCKKDSYDVYIGRPSKWGNPFTHRQDGKTLAKYIVGSRDAAIEAYREWITNGEGKSLMSDLDELRNKVLGCWCSPQSCHGEVLSELVFKKYKNRRIKEIKFKQ